MGFLIKGREHSGADSSRTVESILAKTLNVFYKKIVITRRFQDSFKKIKVLPKALGPKYNRAFKYARKT